jgi:hypothetical protein
MNTMKVPGFTADASLYKAIEHYRQRSVSAAPGFGVQASLRIGGHSLNATCGNCTCDPGQCCAATASGCNCTNCGGGGGGSGSGGGVLTAGLLS